MIASYPNIVHCALVGRPYTCAGYDFVPASFALGRVSADEKLLRSLLLGTDAAYPEHAGYMSVMLRGAVRDSLFRHLLGHNDIIGGLPLEDLASELFRSYDPILSEGVSLSIESLRIRTAQYTIHHIQCDVDGTDVTVTSNRLGVTVGVTSSPISLPGMPVGCSVRVAPGSTIRTATWATRTELSLGHVAANLYSRGRTCLTTLGGIPGFIPEESVNTLRDAAINHPIDAERVAAAVIILANAVFSRTRTT